MKNKRDELRECIQRRAKSALYVRASTLIDREQAEAIRKNVDTLANAIAWQCCDTYEFLEIADIMEWKRTRVRR